MQKKVLSIKILILSKLKLQKRESKNSNLIKPIQKIFKNKKTLSLSQTLSSFIKISFLVSISTPIIEKQRK